MKKIHYYALRIAIALALAAALFSDVDAQPFINGGLAATKERLCVDLNGGYLFDNIGTQISIGANLTSSNVATRNNNISIGQRLYIYRNENYDYTITPSIGYGWVKKDDFSDYDNANGLGKIGKTNVDAIIYGIDIGISKSEKRGSGRWYLFAKHFKGIYAGVGFRTLFNF